MEQPKSNVLSPLMMNRIPTTRRVNHLPPIGEHYMILKALKNGVTEQRIAQALSVDVAEIRRKRDLLNGICPEAIELLKTRRVSATGFSTLRKMKPVRQIKCAELMISANSYTRIREGIPECDAGRPPHKSPSYETPGGSTQPDEDPHGAGGQCTG